MISHPSTTGRILYFALPFLFAVIINIALLFRNLRIHRNFFVLTEISKAYSIVVLLVATVGTAAYGIYAVLNDAWTVREWILFAVIAIVLGLKALIYTADTNGTVIITAAVTIFAAFANEWFFALLRDMAEQTQGEIIWKHTTRNVVGFVEATLIIFAFEYISEVSVHAFKNSTKSTAIFFWVLAPLTVIGILVWNILSFGPFLDSIGYIVAALILFLGAADSTLFFKEKPTPVYE